MVLAAEVAKIEDEAVGEDVVERKRKTKNGFLVQNWVGLFNRCDFALFKA